MSFSLCSLCLSFFTVSPYSLCLCLSVCLSLSVFCLFVHGRRSAASPFDRRLHDLVARRLKVVAAGSDGLIERWMHKLFAWQVSKVAVREYPFGCSSIQGRRPSQEDRAVGCCSMRHAPLQCQAHAPPQASGRLAALGTVLGSGQSPISHHPCEDSVGCPNREEGACERLKP